MDDIQFQLSVILKFSKTSVLALDEIEYVYVTVPGPFVVLPFASLYVEHAF